MWDSVFTAGPTPPLLLATNASFAALQAVLFALLLATYSVHFVVLSILCGALWWAINWFVAELRAAEELKRTRDRDDRGETPRPGDKQGGGEKGAMDIHVISDRDDDAGDEEGGETETEGEEMGSRASLLDPSPKQHRAAEAAERAAGNSGGHLLPRPGSSAASDTSGVHVQGQDSPDEESRLRNRASELDMSSSTTDSEWEKLSDIGAHDSTS